MEQSARELIQVRLGQVKAFLAQESPPRLSESDTKANFIEPIIAALGWEGIGVVTREYYVRNSQEFIDYVLFGPRGALLAIEAKPLQADLAEKHAAQLIQYCAVEGIEWAALTNGRELQFFNTFLKPDLAAKRVLRLDLLAFNTDAEFDVLFEQIWQLSRERMTQPTGVRTWLNQRRLDAALRDLMTTPGSTVLRHVRRALAEREVTATSQEIAHWFRMHLAPALATLPNSAPAGPTSATGGSTSPPIPEEARVGSPTASHAGQSLTAPGSRANTRTIADALKQRVSEAYPDTAWRETRHYVAAAASGNTFLAFKEQANHVVVGLSLPLEFESPVLQPVARQFNWRRITKVLILDSPESVDAATLDAIGAARAFATGEGQRRSAYFGVTLTDLLAADLLRSGAALVLLGQGQQPLARATIEADGQILWQGARYRTPSDRTFGALFGRTTGSLNGWTRWHADLDGVLVPLATLRDRLRRVGDEQPNEDDDDAGGVRA